MGDPFFVYTTEAHRARRKRGTGRKNVGDGGEEKVKIF
jgi:hypothetical protein